MCHNVRLFKSGFRTDSRQVNVDMKTFMAKPGEVEQKWYVVDVADKVLGRAATQIAMVLMGKHRPQYTPNVDTGEYVVVINAARIRVTGNNKPVQRTYQRFSKYPGGLKSVTLAEMLAKNPEKVVSEAVRRMLPKSKLGTYMLAKLKVYAGTEHPHQAQQPESLEI
jgi:large subunit ribosomal protein L13